MRLVEILGQVQLSQSDPISMELIFWRYLLVFIIFSATLIDKFCDLGEIFQGKVNGYTNGQREGQTDIKLQITSKFKLCHHRFTMILRCIFYDRFSNNEQKKYKHYQTHAISNNKKPLFRNKIKLIERLLIINALIYDICVILGHTQPEHIVFTNTIESAEWSLTK